MAVGAVVGQLILCSMAGDAFAKNKVHWETKNVYCCFIHHEGTPASNCASLVPHYSRIELGKYAFCFVRSLDHTSFGIFLTRQYIGAISDELIDAAIIDDGGKFSKNE